MKQLLLIIISIIYGFVFSFIFKYLKKSFFLSLLQSVIFTSLYIYLMYILNSGTINYILKMSIIIGFLLYLKMSNIHKKV